MRLTCFLLCWLTFSAVASVNAQQGKVSIDIKSESLSRVLMQVKDQTGARILYNENLLRDVECRDLKLEGVCFLTHLHVYFERIGEAGIPFGERE